MMGSKFGRCTIAFWLSFSPGVNQMQLAHKSNTPAVEGNTIRNDTRRPLLIPRSIRLIYIRSTPPSLRRQ